MPRRIEYVFIGIIIFVGGWVLWLLERNEHVFIGIMIFIGAWVLGLWLGRWRVKTHRTAILATGIPLTLVGIVALIIGLLNKEANAVAEGLTATDICLQILFSLTAVVFLSSVVLAFRGKQEIAKGMRLGGSIGLVAFLIVFIVLSAGS